MHLEPSPIQMSWSKPNTEVLDEWDILPGIDN